MRQKNPLSEVDAILEQIRQSLKMALDKKLGESTGDVLQDIKSVTEAFVKITAEKFKISDEDFKEHYKMSNGLKDGMVVSEPANLFTACLVLGKPVPYHHLEGKTEYVYPDKSKVYFCEEKKQFALKYSLEFLKFEGTIKF